MRKVWFAPSHRVLVIPRLPKDLKSTLFYSKEEIRHLRSIERIRSQGVMSTLSRYGFGFAKIATRRKLLSEREGRRKRSRAQDDSGLVVTSAYARSQALKERPHFFKTFSCPKFNTSCAPHRLTSPVKDEPKRLLNTTILSDSSANLIRRAFRKQRSAYT